MAKKFVINNNELILGNVVLHKELISGREKYETIGGGYWHYDKNEDVIYFYGSSHDFGKVTKEEFELAKKRNFNETKIIFSNKEFLSEVMKELERINENN